MIVDLVRNDLGRVADVGSVTVPALLRIQPAPGVASGVDGGRDRRRRRHHHRSAGGDVSAGIGHRNPKLRALSLLAGWEQHSRGLYCGAIGMAGPGGDLDLNVAIRTVAVTPTVLRSSGWAAASRSTPIRTVNGGMPGQGIDDHLGIHPRRHRIVTSEPLRCPLWV